ncbi:PAS domain-containing protein [bacterium]|nr:PAS domain-containing protein [bacterium]
MIGELNRDLLEAFIERIPIEFSVLDANDKVVAWNKHGTRIFKRATVVLGKDVRDCHPKKSQHKVEEILREMKEGKRDKARFWIDLPFGPNGEKQKIIIEYYALIDSEGKYLGCLEATQNIGELQAITGEKRLLD